MPRRKKKNFDDWDYQDMPDEQDMADLLQPEVEKVSLEDFCVMEKVSAFCRAYMPCREGDDGYEQFDDARLREVFKAIPCGLGDPLKVYMEQLKLLGGFTMEMSMLGEPCIFARRKG